MAAAHQNLVAYGLEPEDLPLVDALAQVGQQLNDIEAQIEALRKAQR